MRSQLDASLQEIEELHKARDRQKEMVQAIINQRDMYRTLLAQSTPLPGDSPMKTRRSSAGLGMHVETDSVGGDGGSERGVEGETSKQLRELKEQFEAYRKEKAENDKILHQQLDEMREQTSTMRLTNANLSSKVSSPLLFLSSYPQEVHVSSLIYGSSLAFNPPTLILKATQMGTCM